MQWHVEEGSVVLFCDIDTRPVVAFFCVYFVFVLCISFQACHYNDIPIITFCVTVTDSVKFAMCDINRYCVIFSRQVTFTSI
jgi:uncharacterized membrane protein (DUF485 family)